MLGVGVTEDPTPAMVLAPANPPEDCLHWLWRALLAVNDAGEFDACMPMPAGLNSARARLRSTRQSFNRLAVESVSW